MSLRYRLHGDPRWRHSELVGVVVSAEDSGGAGQITVMDRHGGVHLLDVEDIVAAKVFSL